MGSNTSSPSLENFNKTKKLTLEEFKKQIPRKMTIHFLSNTSKDCINFIEFITNEKIINPIGLLEKDINKKINLYSFMNYKIYSNASDLMTAIKDKVDKAFKNLKTEIFSEILIILDNVEIENQIDEIRTKFKNNPIIQANTHLNPFLIIVSPIGN